MFSKKISICMLGWWFLNLNLARDCDQFSMLSSWKSRHLPCYLSLATLNYISTDFLCLSIICVRLLFGVVFWWSIRETLLVSNVMFGFRPRQMKRLKSAGYDFYSMPMLCGDLLIFCPERLSFCCCPWAEPFRYD